MPEAGAGATPRYGPGLMDELFEAIREACERAVWSRGVELARRGAVHTQSAGPDELLLRVEARAGRAAPVVRLSPGDEAWECDCGGADDPCEHVAAAVIAARRARESGESAPRAESPPAQLGYRLSRAPGGLALARVLVREGVESPLPATLAAWAAGRGPGPAPLASVADLAVERLIDPRRTGALPRESMPRLLNALVACEDVRLDGEPVTVSLEPVLPIALVEDRGDGVELRLVPDPRHTETFANGVTLCGGVLRPLGDAKLGAREREELLRGRWFPADALGRLVGEILPDLRARLPVEVRTDRLPREQALQPRLRATVRREGDALAVSAELVYGDPPIARVEDGRLVALDARAMPRRIESAEEALTTRLERELQLAPGATKTLAAPDAIAFRAALERFSGELVGRAHDEFRLAGELAPALDAGAGRFALEFTASGGGRADAARVLRAWREGESLVPLAGGGFAPVPAASAENQRPRSSSSRSRALSFASPSGRSAPPQSATPFAKVSVWRGSGTSRSSMPSPRSSTSAIGSTGSSDTVVAAPSSFTSSQPTSAFSTRSIDSRGSARVRRGSITRSTARSAPLASGAGPGPRPAAQAASVTGSGASAPSRTSTRVSASPPGARDSR
jgi:hypothetical protein